MLNELALLATLLGGSSCNGSAPKLGDCVSASTDGEQVLLVGQDGSEIGSSNGGPSAPAPTEPELDSRCTQTDIQVRCDAPAREQPTAAPVTLSDIAAFRPSSASHGMEPNGWAVVGLPTNFFSGGGASIDAGALLGQAAEVRFTPVAWRWNYGDGSSRASATPGRAWPRTDEFAATATSHVFERRGRFVITLTVDYRAEWRVAGGPWVAINGILSLPAPPREVLVVGARTVLVEEHCISDPTGPGC